MSFGIFTYFLGGDRYVLVGEGRTARVEMWGRMILRICAAGAPLKPRSPSGRSTILVQGFWHIEGLLPFS